MENRRDNFLDNDVTDQMILDLDTQVVSKTFISNVFVWMFAALVISGGVSWFFAQSSMFDAVFRSGNKLIHYGIMFAPLGFVIALGAGFRRFSFNTLSILYILFSVIMGVSFSYIFHAFSLTSITTIFFTSAAIFGIMAVAGYRTSIDLTKMGSILYMALIGVIIVSVINIFFVNSGPLDYILSYVGVLIFVGLTAYDMQKIKRMAAVVETNTEEGRKLILMGALNLYLDFINLFLLLLRLFGGRD